MGYYLSIGIWNEGKTLDDEGKVKKKIKTISDDDILTMRAHVNGPFGFVHHPVIRFDRTKNTVIGFFCDCWSLKNKTSICAHCVALLASECDDKEILISATPEDNKELAWDSVAEVVHAEVQKKHLDTVSTLSDSLDESGKRMVKGRVKCDFGFVHYPVLTLLGGDVADYHCDCYFLSKSSKMCPHCELLLNKLRVQ